jgi:hypothetical protein
VTPPLTGVSHPKKAVLRLAARQGAIAVRARKVDASGAMRVVARGLSEKLAAFHGDLRHKVRDEGWKCSAVEVTVEEMVELEGGGLAILRTDDALAGGANSSGGPCPPTAPSFDAASIDTGSSASSKLIRQEVKVERLRGEALARQMAAASAEREAAAVVAAEARVAAAVAAAAEREAAAVAAAEREAAAVATAEREAAAVASAEREAAAVAAAEARVAAALEAAAEREATMRKASIAALMKLGMSRPDAEELLRSA